MAEIFSLEESHSELKSVRKANCVVFSCDFFPPHPRCFINRAWSYIDDIEDTRCRCIREHVWSFSPILGLYSALQLDAAFLQSFAHCDCCPWMRPTRGVSFHSPEWRLSGASAARCLEPRDNREDCALAKDRGLLSSGSRLAAF